jgi:hypothetical protein
MRKLCARTPNNNSTHMASDVSMNKSAQSLAIVRWARGQCKTVERKNCIDPIIKSIIEANANEESEPTIQVGLSKALQKKQIMRN